MYKVKLTKHNTLVAMEVLEMDESIRDKGAVFEPDDERLLKIESIVKPSINATSIYLRGANSEDDFKTAFRSFNTTADATTYYIKLIKTFNAHKQHIKDNEKPKIENAFIIEV